MRRYLHEAGRALFSVYGFLVFGLLMLLLLPLFTICFFLGRVRGGNILYRLCRFWADAFFLLTWIRTPVTFEGRPAPGRACVFVSNHISYLDIPMMMKAIRGRPVRILAKAEMAKIPVFGFIYRQGTVMVRRENGSKRKESLEELLDFMRLNISVFVCPEGTFNTTGQPLKNFYDGAFRVAIESQAPVCPVIFPDTRERLDNRSALSLNPGKCRAIFLPPVFTSGLTATDLPGLRQRVFDQMEAALIRHGAGWIRKLPGEPVSGG